MSGSDTGAMNSGNLGIQKQPVIQNMNLAFGVDGAGVYNPLAGNSPAYQTRPAGNGTGTGAGAGDGMMSSSMAMTMGFDTVKKKRGRPRKYGPADGSTMPMPLSSAPPSQPTAAFSPPTQPPPPPPPLTQPPVPLQAAAPPPAATGAQGSPPPPSFKKARGRPPGSSKKHQLEALGSPGIGFTPHVIVVKTGEDVAAKIMTFSLNGPRAICILSANGTISSVTLRQAATSGGSVTYESGLTELQGLFEILSLSGSFMVSESGGPRSRTGGLSISLAAHDGRVLGGGVAGGLTAATPVQVVVGSFIADGGREFKRSNQTEHLSAPSKLHGGVGLTGPSTSSPPSHGTASESSGGPGSPLNQSTVAGNSNPPSMSGIPWK